MKYLTGFCLLILFSSCDAFFKSRGQVVDAKTLQPIDTLYVRNFYPAELGDTIKNYDKEVYFHKDGKFEDSYTTGGIVTEKYNLLIYAKGYKRKVFLDLPGDTTMTVYLEKIDSTKH
jgi:hypothetical protein